MPTGLKPITHHSLGVSSLLGDNFLGSNSVLDHPDWLTRLDSRLRNQEEELTLVKSALADALRRLSFYDQQIPLLRRQVLEGEAREECQKGGGGYLGQWNRLYNSKEETISSNSQWRRVKLDNVVFHCCKFPARNSSSKSDWDHEIQK